MKKVNEVKNNLKRGFTLLELLIVILIIGILAAIALPQYRLVVDKAEFTKYQSMVASLRNAYDDYVLTHGQATRNFDDLSIALPSSFTEVGADKSDIKCVSDNNMWCCMRPFYKNEEGTNAYGGTIYCGKKDTDFSIVYQEILYQSTGKIGNRAGKCLAKIDNTRANRLCKSIGKDITGHLAIVDPVTGNSTGGVYYQYTLK